MFLFLFRFAVVAFGVFFPLPRPQSGFFRHFFRLFFFARLIYKNKCAPFFEIRHSSSDRQKIHAHNGALLHNTRNSVYNGNRTRAPTYDTIGCFHSSFSLSLFFYLRDSGKKTQAYLSELSALAVQLIHTQCILQTAAY